MLLALSCFGRRGLSCLLRQGIDFQNSCHCEARSDVAIRIPFALFFCVMWRKENGLPRQCVHWLAMTDIFDGIFQQN